MRNKYKGICYYCGKEVLPNAGHFERHEGGWRTIHAECVFEQRKEKAETAKNKSLMGEQNRK